MKTENKKVIAIVGPTASGKTALSVDLAKIFDTEIVSADSRQIFKEFDIATAKPSIAEMQGIKHHLMSIIKPTDDYTVANFADDAGKVIKTLHNNQKIPIIVGGTGLYFRILLENYDLPRVEPNQQLRNELHNIEKEQGAERLHKMLSSLDPKLAEQMHPNNTVKIIRAIEVCKTLGIPMSKAQKVKQDKEFDVCWIGLGHLNGEERNFLYDRIDKRVDSMISQGLEKEAKNLFEKYGKIPSLLRTIGYQELSDYFEGICNINESIEKIKQNSRRYAKRQLTWFRKNENINWLDIKNKTHKELLEESLGIISRELKL